MEQIAANYTGDRALASGCEDLAIVQHVAVSPIPQRSLKQRWPRGDRLPIEDYSGPKRPIRVYVGLSY